MPLRTAQATLFVEKLVVARNDIPKSGIGREEPFAAPQLIFRFGQQAVVQVIILNVRSILIWSASRMQEKDHCVHEGKVAVLYPASRLKELCLRALMEIRAFLSLSH